MIKKKFLDIKVTTLFKKITALYTSHNIITDVNSGIFISQTYIGHLTVKDQKNM